MKTCNKCEQEKKLSDFYKRSTSKDGLHNMCKHCFKVWAQKRYAANRDALKSNNKSYYDANKASILKQKEVYYENNKENIKAYCNSREKERAAYKRRRGKDPTRRAIRNMRVYMYQILKGTCKCASQLELLGCTREQYRSHMEAQFTDGMSWDNYGEWHQDHIIPVSSFDNKDLEQQKVCWHYTNFQPLWAKDNLKKHNKVGL